MTIYRISETQRAAVVGVLLAVAVSMTACGTTKDEPAAVDTPELAVSTTPSASVTSSSNASGEIVVFAAASLTDAFTELGKKFEAAHPGAKVTFQFGSSATLAAQITQAAPADVFAAASPATMKTVTDAGDADGDPEVFVQNRLEIATPKDNPGKVTGLSDFTKDDLAIVLCAAAAPCGAAADKVFTAAGITPSVDSREADVKAVLTKVELGEADAALVYKTDVLAAADKVSGIEFPEAEEAINDYPIVALKGSDNAETASAWVDYITSDEAQQVLEDAGFEGV